VDAQRVALQTLGTRLAVLSIASFLCKCVSAVAAYFGRGQLEQSESIIYLVTVLSVQALPSCVTLLLLQRYHFGSGGGSSGALMQSLLTHDGTAACGSDGAASAAHLESHRSVE
jgi:hypothetical protein